MSDIIRELIGHINQCNHDLEHIAKDKQVSEARLKDLLGHTKVGSHTHLYDDYKIVITTGLNYTLDKEAFGNYLMGDKKIDPRYSIVKQVTKYELNNKSIKDCDMYGTEQDRMLKDSFLRSSEKKIHVSIKKIQPVVTGDVFNDAVDSLSSRDRNGFGDY